MLDINMDEGLLDSVETNTGVLIDETNTGTDPNNSDTDADGFPDQCWHLLNMSIE